MDGPGDLVVMEVAEVSMQSSSCHISQQETQIGIWLIGFEIKELKQNRKTKSTNH